MMADTSIKKFYDGADIFITGGSGFVGRVLIEKLLRSCEGISRIFLLMRGKKGIEAGKRIEKLTDCMLFEKLRSTNASALDKLEVIEGDMMQLRLGISSQDFQKIKNCSQIFHCAASVRFDDPLKDAILMNTRGTREVCLLAKEMPNLKSLVHVSTTFIQPKTYFADEVFYPADFEWQTFIKMAENFDHDMMNCLEKKLTKHAPNTYTFTKHLAEQVCKEFREFSNLPVIIMRPSIISSTEYEPFTGHLDNMNGPFAFTIGSEVGVYQVTTVSSERKLDYIPVDILIKGMIVAGWKDWKERTKEIPIYNAAGIKNPSFGAITMSLPHEILPAINAIMYPGPVFTECKYYAWIIRIVEMIIPALILDRLLVMSGGKPRVMKVQRKIYEADQATAHFSAKDYTFTSPKFKDLGADIPNDEREDFFIDEKFHQYIHKVAIATYLVMLKEFFGQKIPKDNERAKRRYRKVLIISRTYQVMAYSLLIYFVSKIFMSFFDKN